MVYSNDFRNAYQPKSASLRFPRGKTVLKQQLVVFAFDLIGGIFFSKMLLTRALGSNQKLTTF